LGRTKGGIGVVIYVLYGQPGSGKTSLGKLLASHLNTPFIIDGDEFREMFTNKNYDREGREENIRNANAVATYSNKKGKTGEWVAIYYRDKPTGLHGRPINTDTDVVMCLVNPYEHLRKELSENNKGEVIEVLLQSNRELRKEYHVKDFEKGKPNYIINTDEEAQKTWEKLKYILKL
jgi:broad-specificity NMP kinase